MSIDVNALGKVAVLMGGSSAERPVSLMSGRACSRPCAPKAWTPMPLIRHSVNWLS